MCIRKKWRELKLQKQQENEHPGLIEEFLADSNRKTMPLNLYLREIHRLEKRFPKIAIRKDNQLNNTDLWECTVFKR